MPISPKTYNSIREIHFPPSTIEWLAKYKLHNGSGYVFPTRKGTLNNPKNWLRQWYGLCKEIDIPSYGIHSLRHTWATRALEQNINIKVVSDMLGHASIQTTMNIYQDVLDAQKRDAAKKLDALF